MPVRLNITIDEDVYRRLKSSLIDGEPDHT